MKFPLTTLAALALPLLAQPARAEWPDHYLARVQVQALVQTLNANILASTSATLELEKWCAEHALASPARIQARQQSGNAVAASAEQRARLGVSADEPIRHRSVKLYCGTHLLSEADNWYVPSRLSPGMNRQLEETDTPFGKVVLPLAPYRRTFAMRKLWSPLPDGWALAPPAVETAAAGTLAIPAALFEHRAVLYTATHLPIAEVRETYQRGILAFR